MTIIYNIKVVRGKWIFFLLVLILLVPIAYSFRCDNGVTVDANSGDGKICILTDRDMVAVTSGATYNADIFYFKDFGLGFQNSNNVIFNAKMFIMDGSKITVNDHPVLSGLNAGSITINADGGYIRHSEFEAIGGAGAKGASGGINPGNPMDYGTNGGTGGTGGAGGNILFDLKTSYLYGIDFYNQGGAGGKGGTGGNDNCPGEDDGDGGTGGRGGAGGVVTIKIDESESNFLGWNDIHIIASSGGAGGDEPSDCGASGNRASAGSPGPAGTANSYSVQKTYDSTYPALITDRLLISSTRGGTFVYSCNSGIDGYSRISTVALNDVFQGYVCTEDGFVFDHEYSEYACKGDGYSWLNEDCTVDDYETCSNYKYDSGNFVRTLDFSDMNNCCGNDVYDDEAVAIYDDAGTLKHAYCDGTEWVFDEEGVCMNFLGDDASSDSFNDDIVDDDLIGSCCGYASNDDIFSKSYTQELLDLPYTSKEVTYIKYPGDFFPTLVMTDWYCNLWSDGNYHWASDVDDEIMNVNDQYDSSCEKLDTGFYWDYNSNAKVGKKCCGDDDYSDEGMISDDSIDLQVCYRNYRSPTLTSFSYYDSTQGGSNKERIYVHNTGSCYYSTLVTYEDKLKHYITGCDDNKHPNSAQVSFGDRVSYGGYNKYVASYLGNIPVFKSCGEISSSRTNVHYSFIDEENGDHYFTINNLRYSDSNAMFHDKSILNGKCSGSCQIYGYELIPWNNVDDEVQSDDYKVVYENINLPIDTNKHKYLEFDFKWEKQFGSNSVMQLCHGFNCVDDVLDYSINSEKEGVDTTIMIPLSRLGVINKIDRLTFIIPSKGYIINSASRDIGSHIRIKGDVNYYCDDYGNDEWITSDEVDDLTYPHACQNIRSFASYTGTNDADTLKCCGDDSFYAECGSLSSSECTSSPYCYNSFFGGCRSKSTDSVVYEHYDGDAVNNCCAFGNVFNHGELVDLESKGVEFSDYKGYMAQDVKAKTNVNNLNVQSKRDFVCHDGESAKDSSSDKSSTVGQLIHCDVSNSCDYTENYFCSIVSEDWEDRTGAGDLGWTWDGSIKPYGGLGGGYEKDIWTGADSSLEGSECCLDYQCWNGEACVNAYDKTTGDIVNDGSSNTYSFLSKRVNLPYSMSRYHQADQHLCVVDGSGSAYWEPIYYKEMFFGPYWSYASLTSATYLEHGYCFDKTQCFSVGGCHDQGEHYAAYDLYCGLNSDGEGVWRHKNKFLIDSFYNRGQFKTNFEISCGGEYYLSRHDLVFDNVLNVWWNQENDLDTYSSYLDGHKVQLTGLSSFMSYCTYQDDDVKSMGVVLHKSVNPKTAVEWIIGKEYVDANVNDYGNCDAKWSSNDFDCYFNLVDGVTGDTFSVSYDGAKDILIFSRADFVVSFTEFSWYTNLLNTIKSVISGLFNLDANVEFPDVTFSDYFYYGKYGSSKRIMGYSELINEVEVATKSLKDDVNFYVDEDVDYIERKYSTDSYSFYVDLVGFDSSGVENFVSLLESTTDVTSTNVDSNTFRVSGHFDDDSKMFWTVDSKGNYWDYFGQFTRNLRVYDFE